MRFYTLHFYLHPFPKRMYFLCSRDTTIINHSPCHSSNSFNEVLPVSDYRNQEMENRYKYYFFFFKSILFRMYSIIAVMILCIISLMYFVASDGDDWRSDSIFLLSIGSVLSTPKFWRRMLSSISYTSICTRNRSRRMGLVCLPPRTLLSARPSAPA